MLMVLKYKPILYLIPIITSTLIKTKQLLFTSKFMISNECNKEI